MRNSSRSALAITLCGVLLAPLAACVSTGVKAGGPIQGGAQTKKAAPTGGDDAFGCNGTNQYSWCSNAPQAIGSPAPLPGSSDCGGYSWCTTQAAVPDPIVDAYPGGRPPNVPGPDAPLPHAPGFCATKVDPPDTGIYIDTIDDEIVGTALSSCLGGPAMAPRRFMLVLTLYWHPQSSSVWVPLGPPAQGVDIRIPYQYPAFIDSHVVTPCVTGASYFLKIQMPQGPNNLNFEGQPMPPMDENGEAFHADHLCHTP